MLARQEEELYELVEEDHARVRIPGHRQTRERRPELNTRLRARVFLLITVLCVMAMIVTVRSGIVASRGYDLVKMQRQAAAVERENDHLKIEIAQLKSPDRIRRLASDNLGMSTPKNVYFANEQ
ncbi:hypothetical protein TAMA11512_04710 [Selenomonas sp. TAMA-11512]|uniref:cell division protein FtsL n=1 Tax=Selenomonas sp. TAMA-11512 TaxID=3095337 RepID=UPI00308B0596|nr:hypothetical protein TAMA11512_04710 [Selenomonas sp. TAMA-11512]